jgi:DNA-binding NtrC family response regulator
MGTSFTVYFPRDAGVMPAAAGLAAGKTPRGGDETILFVDDELVLRKLGEAALKRMGYSVILAHDGREGLELFRQRKGRINLVILDLMLPLMSGTALFREIRRLDPKAKVIVASGYGETPQKPKIDDLRPSAFLSKPFYPDDLARLVRDVLDSGRAAN